MVMNIWNTKVMTTDIYLNKLMNIEIPSKYTDYLCLLQYIIHTICFENESIDQ
jgi:hypothetical protein